MHLDRPPGLKIVRSQRITGNSGASQAGMMEQEVIIYEKQEEIRIE